jgi:hypothetical protein
VQSQSIADSCFTIIDYCEKGGFKEIAASLKDTSAIKEMFRGFHPHAPDVT